VLMTDWTKGFKIQDRIPHSFNALQKFTMAMEDYEKNKGKKTFFGRDKGLDSFYKFEKSFNDLIFAMVLDGVISRNDKASLCHDKLVALQYMFWDAFSGWDSAKHFFYNYFIENKDDAIKRIGSIIK